MNTCTDEVRCFDFSIKFQLFVFFKPLSWHVIRMKYTRAPLHGGYFFTKRPAATGLSRSMALQPRFHEQQKEGIVISYLEGVIYLLKT